MNRGKVKYSGKQTLKYSVDAGFVHGKAPANDSVLKEKINTTLVLQQNYKFKYKISDDNRVS
jgi:hypothetical protein